jgi:hypothetical protein
MDPFFLRSYLGILKDAGLFSGAKDKVNRTFNSTELKRLRVVIPPMDEQEEVCAEIARRSKECNEVTPGYKLRYGWTGWPRIGTRFPDAMESLLAAPAADWELDHLRLLEYSFSGRPFPFAHQT